MTYLNGRMYMFSGRGGEAMAPIEEKGHIWVLEPLTEKWTSVSPSSGTYPEARSYHCITKNAVDTIYIHAGCPENGRLSDLWAFNIHQSRWKELAPAPDPPRGGTSIAFVDGKVYRMNAMSLRQLPLTASVMLLTPPISGNLFGHDLLLPFKRAEDAHCPVDLDSIVACNLMQEACSDFDHDGLIPYLRRYACTPFPVRSLVLLGMLIWLLVLFGVMAMTASRHMAVHLELIVSELEFSETLAGVTIFASGNGCTDLFATLALPEQDADYVCSCHEGE
ncbi:hypothetical protein LTR12_017110 [Friedmanniomyces endolithicus]|nr:hypothetical protein LTR12_017110 [Friedmanniomyces endolithicus]